MPTKSSPSSNTPSVWIQLYFVLASLLGLLMIVVGSAMGLNTLLTQYLFTPQKRTNQPPYPYVLDQKTVTATPEMTVEQEQLLDQWEQDYRSWLEEESTYDYETESRKRTLATSLAMILVATPVFLLHVPFVFRHAKHN